MNIMWIAVAQYDGYFNGMRADIKSILNFAEFILATPALFYTGGVFFKGSYYALKNHVCKYGFTCSKWGFECLRFLNLLYAYRTR